MKVGDLFLQVERLMKLGYGDKLVMDQDGNDITEVFDPDKFENFVTLTASVDHEMDKYRT